MDVAAQFALGIVLFVATVVSEAAITVWVLEWRARHLRRLSVSYSVAAGLWHVTLITVSLMAVHLAQMTLWALVYLIGGAFDDFHRALFFSMSCFSTLGFANYLPGTGWDLLAALQGVVGSLVMGWSAGVLFAAANGFYQEMLASRRAQLPS